MVELFFDKAPGGIESQLSQIIWVGFCYGLAEPASFMVCRVLLARKRKLQVYLKSDLSVLMHGARSPPPSLGPLKGLAAFLILYSARCSCERKLQVAASAIYLLVIPEDED